MDRATTLIPPDDPRLSTDWPTITLARDARYRRRIAWKTDCGKPFLLDLPEATYLPDGTGLALENGTIYIVRAAAEDLLEITAADRHALMRIAWHIGNRHTPAEIHCDAIYILPDHVLADMIRGLGGTVRPISRPFEPEGGAYGGKRTLERGHHHQPRHNHAPDHDHPHDHPHEHSHNHDDGHSHPHAHRHPHDPA